MTLGTLQFPAEGPCPLAVPSYWVLSIANSCLGHRGGFGVERDFKQAQGRALAAGREQELRTFYLHTDDSFHTICWGENPPPEFAFPASSLPCKRLRYRFDQILPLPLCALAPGERGHTPSLDRVTVAIDALPAARDGPQTNLTLPFPGPRLPSWLTVSHNPACTAHCVP